LAGNHNFYEQIISAWNIHMYTRLKNSEIGVTAVCIRLQRVTAVQAYTRLPQHLLQAFNCNSFRLPARQGSLQTPDNEKMNT
jgi:hypothetical protein